MESKHKFADIDWESQLNDTIASANKIQKPFSNINSNFVLGFTDRLKTQNKTESSGSDMNQELINRFSIKSQIPITKYLSNTNSKNSNTIIRSIDKTTSISNNSSHSIKSLQKHQLSELKVIKIEDKIKSIDKESLVRSICDLIENLKTCEDLKFLSGWQLISYHSFSTSNKSTVLGPEQMSTNIKLDPMFALAKEYLITDKSDANYFEVLIKIITQLLRTSENIFCLRLIKKEDNDFGLFSGLFESQKKEVEEKLNKSQAIWETAKNSKPKRRRKEEKKENSSQTDTSNQNQREMSAKNKG